MWIIRIDAPHFCAGIEIDPETKVVTGGAPILRYMVGWTARRAWEYAKGKGWTPLFLRD